MKYYKKTEKKVNYNSNEYTKCWTCKNACGGCCWSREFKPVPGWEAKKTFQPMNGEHAESYFIISCPEYERG